MPELASKTDEKLLNRNNRDATSTDVYSQLVKSQHVSGIIMPIVRRTEYIKLRVVLAWLCWLRSCGAGTRALYIFIYSVLLTMGIMMPKTC